MTDRNKKRLQTPWTNVTLLKERVTHGSHSCDNAVNGRRRRPRAPSTMSVLRAAHVAKRVHPSTLSVVRQRRWASSSDHHHEDTHDSTVYPKEGMHVIYNQIILISPTHLRVLCAVRLHWAILEEYSNSCWCMHCRCCILPIRSPTRRIQRR